MSEIGYNGRALLVKYLGAVIAAVISKSAPHSRELVNVTSDDDDGWRRLLPEPGGRSLNLSVEGVVSAANLAFFLEQWLGNVMTGITLEYPDGQEASAEDGFGLASFEVSGQQDAHVAFTAEFQSSGPVTLTPAS
jgi:predicted secreted protein